VYHTQRLYIDEYVNKYMLTCVSECVNMEEFSVEEWVCGGSGVELLEKSIGVFAKWALRPPGPQDSC
jgi:hypothetical protein